MEVLSTQRRSVPAGIFLMGSERFYDEERPVRQVEVAAFRIDRAPVTNAEFGRFCAETGHVTCAERAGGGLVFRPGAQPDGNWAFTEGASWRHPVGPGSSLDRLELHPVVLVSARDAAAFAAWSGGRLPTEAEWEWAARGGLVSFDYAWGDQLRVEGSIPANVWNGAFPFEREGGFDLPLTTPVASYPDNGFGLSDMIGNVWEITADIAASPAGGCCHEPQERVGQLAAGNIIKGGSHLCAENHCRRYRPAARQSMSEPTSHIGFRCAA